MDIAIRVERGSLSPVKRRLHSLGLGKLDRDGLAKHDNSVAFHDGDTAESLARLERFDDERLLGSKGDLGDLLEPEANKRRNTKS
jgi:hypothetical protein